MSNARMASQEPLQSTHHLLLIRPGCFYSNPETQESNHFQTKNDTGEETPHQTLAKARTEFDGFCKQLQQHHIQLTLLEGSSKCPDHVFPNWAVSFHDKTAQLFSMRAPNRRLEKTPAHIQHIAATHRITQDYSSHEPQGQFLEGTSSMVLDRVNQVAYMGESPRSNLTLATAWAQKNGYQLLHFNTEDSEGAAIYHTDVLMYIGTTLAAVCRDVIQPKDRHIIDKLSKTHTLLHLSAKQLPLFCGNCLEVMSPTSGRCLVLSDRALAGYRPEQMQLLEQHFDTFITSDLSTIESHGGGSARCMLMEMF